MKWYVAKIIYRIICVEGNQTPQFDEQLRLVAAEDDLHAFQKARIIGEGNEDNFLNDNQKPVTWKFIDVSQLQELESLGDGIEISSRIYEEENADHYIKQINNRAKFLHERCLQKTFEMN